MTILSNILEWSATRPLWQQDAMRRLLEQPSLGSSDIDELTILCKREYGVAVESECVATPYTAPKEAESLQGHVRAAHLTRVHSVSANALLPNQTLTIATAGLTVVYGDNGSGKSGYVRVLKQVCRARGGADPLLPNVYAAEVTPTSASICYRVPNQLTAPITDTEDDEPADIADIEVHWTPSTIAPPILSEVSVFDSRSAAVYVDDRNEVAYLPYGTDVFPRLADVADEVGLRLNRELELVTAARDTFDTIPKTTAAGAVLDNLHVADALERVTTLASLSADDIATHDALRAEIAQWKANDPVLRARELKQQAARIRAVHGRLVQINTALANTQIDVLHAAWQARTAARDASDLIASETFAAAPIVGVGSESWLVLWNAARQFAAEGAQPPQPFPPAPDKGARCVLCQQSIDDATQQRLSQFDAFVRSTAASALADADRVLTERIAALRALSIATVADAEFLQEIRAGHHEIATSLSARLAALEARCAALLAAGAGPPDHRWPLRDAVDDATAGQLSDLGRELEAEATRCEALVDAATRAAQLQQLANLEARVGLTPLLPRIQAEITRCRLRIQLRACLASVVTTGITKQGTSMLRDAVSDPLAVRFAAEMSALRLTHLPVALSAATGKKGRALHGLALTKRTADTTATAAIVSEGEYRGLALAAFLAEIALQDSVSTVVFDDPVSSVDHGRREYVAQRIAEIASRRPVLVFTHDMPFLWVLGIAASQAGVPMAGVQFNRTAAGAGKIDADVPWDGTDVKQRIGALKQRAQKLQKLLETDPVAYATEVRSIYAKLRSTWERAVEEVLFNGALRRFQKEIKTQSLKHLHLLRQDQVSQCFDGMTRTSDWIEAHDHAAALPLTAPTPTDVERDVLAFATWHKSVIDTHSGKPQAVA
jgi:energy-coupling factor transporter ATP-binding protein EcfA2